MEYTIDELIYANNEKVTCKRRAIDEFDESLEKLRDTAEAVKETTHDLDIDNTGKDSKDETERAVYKCRKTSAKALHAAHLVIRNQYDVVNKEKKNAYGRLENDAEDQEAVYNLHVLTSLRDLLKACGYECPMAYIPGNLREDADLLDVIMAVREKSTTGRAGKVACMLDSELVECLRSLKLKPCKITLRYVTVVKRDGLRSSSRLFRYDMAVITSEGFNYFGDVLGHVRMYGDPPTPDADTVKNYGHPADRVNPVVGQSYDKFEVSFDGQAFWR